MTWLTILTASCTVASGSPAALQNPARFVSPPGSFRTSWIGNSFGGDGGPNGFGYWVQNGIDEIEVTPDGNVFAGVEWDEAGRCIGRYRDGQVNRVLIQAPDKDGLAGSAWGWGTGNRAMAVDGNRLFFWNTGGKLMRFRFSPDLQGETTFEMSVDAPVKEPEAAVAMAARGSRLVMATNQRLQTRDPDTLAEAKTVYATGILDVAVHPDGTLWTLQTTTLTAWSEDLTPLRTFPHRLVNPTALAFDPRGRAVLCENGPRQQVVIAALSDAQREIRRYGDPGGLRSGRPGEIGPNKLFALRGANFDGAGWLFVASGFASGPNGNAFLRAYDPGGRLRWERHSTSFVDTFGFVPGTDGGRVYSRTAIYDLNLSRTKPGSEARLTGITLDPLDAATDGRARYGQTTLVRRIGNREIVYMIGQYANGFTIYRFRPGTKFLTPVDSIRAPQESWAWHVDEEGAIWWGDAPDRKIRRYALLGFRRDNTPIYDWNKFETYDIPTDFDHLRRVIYDSKTDRMLLSGYLRTDTVDSWGVMGKTVRRIDGFRRGPRQDRWTRATPVNPTGENGKPLTPVGFATAGDYVFFGMVKPENDVQYTHIHRVSDGRYVGSLAPGKEVGEQAGWQDMPYSVAAMQRKNGEYLILVEEDFRAKQLLYRWTPPR